MPKVTVLMPTYNVAPFIEEAIHSVLQQRYRDFSLLIVDDSSTDGTWERICQFDDPRICRIRNEQNLGLAENLNKGLSLIHTEYVARMDGDDIAEPDWLESEVRFLDSHPEVGICGGGFVVFGSRCYTVIFPSRAKDVAVNMLFECSITVPTFRTAIVKEHGLRYRSDAFPAEDYRFWADCLEVTTCCNIPRVLFHYRMHPKQISTSLHEQQKRQSDAVRRIMLQRLNANISDKDTEYFIHHYVRGTITSQSDFRQMRRFSRRLLSLNRQGGQYHPSALRKRCRKQEVQTLYNYIVHTFFADGYRFSQYLRYLFSGCSWQTTLRYEIKFLIKSLLHRSL